MGVAAVSKAAHEKSRARQVDFATEQAKITQAQVQAEEELAAKRKKLIKAVAEQTALQIRQKREAEALEQLKKEQKKQKLIVLGLGTTAVGLIAYSIIKR